MLAFATERKNKVDLRLRPQMKVNYVQLFFTLIILECSHLDDILKGNNTPYVGMK